MPKRILFVDNSSENSKMLKNLSHDEYEIILAKKKEEVFLCLNDKTNNIVAILINVDIEYAFDLMEEIGNVSAYSRIPLIAISTKKLIDIEVKALTLGASFFGHVPDDIPSIEKQLWNLIINKETVGIIEMTKRDTLTGLFGRFSFFKLAEQIIASKEPGYYVMACFDIDRFKVVNDQYGNAKGDFVLKHIANTFRKGFSKCNGICCRISADNFAVLYPKGFIDSKEIEDIKNVASIVDGTMPPLSFSVGRYIVEDVTLAASAMYDRACIAKASIKGRYDVHVATFTKDMLYVILNEQEIVGEMKSALENKEFEVWFQPQYNHSTKALIGAEALVRWRHPKKGLIMPNNFIPIFEKNGFIYELDKFVWNRVFEIIRKWIDEGRAPLPISINISRYDLFRENILDVIKKGLKKYNVPAELIRVEITESAFSNSEDQVVGAVKKFVSQGFTVEIDDFGSGYSSLNILKDVPAQVIKLDMRFLDGAETNDRTGNIIESVIRMAKWLGMSVIAEGVENMEQADYLKSIGCNYIQGYAYEKVIPLEKYEELAFNASKEEKLLALETVEKFDNNSFWNPKSMDTLIFNTYIGGACIFEWHNEKIEVLRANDKYAKIVFGENGTINDALTTKWQEHMSKKTFLTTKKAIEYAIETGEDSIYEGEYNNLPKTVGKTYLRTMFRVIARTNDRFLVYCTNENITSKREALHQLQVIMENINGGICAIDCNIQGEEKVIFANDTFYSMLGYKSKEDYDENVRFGDNIDPDDKKRVKGIVSELMKEGKTAIYNYHCIKKDGSKILIRCNSSIISMLGVSSNVLLSIMNDITEISLMEQKEKELSEQIKIIMENVDSGISAFTLIDGKIEILLGNKKSYSILGYTEEEFINEKINVFDLIHEDDRSKVMDVITKVITTKMPHQYRYRCYTKDKKLIYLHVTASAVSIQGINESVCLLVINDVTDIAEANRKISDISQRLQTIMDNVGCGIIASTTNKKYHEILFANDKFYNIIGYNKEQYKKESDDYLFMVNESDRKEIDNELKEAIRSGKGVLEYQIIKKNGKRIWIRHRITSTFISGFKNLVYLSIIEDITFEKIARDRIIDLNANLLNMMNDTPGGFARFKLMKGGALQTIYANEAFCNIRGMSYKDVSAHKLIDSIHPDDVSLIEKAVKEMVKTKEAQNVKCRLKSFENDYLPFNVFGRATIDSNGEIYINAFFTELSNEEKKAFSIRNAIPFILTTIMAKSNDLTFAKEQNFTYVCCSPAFVEMANKKSESDIVGKTDYDIFPKEIADKFRNDDLKLLQNGESMIDYIEPIPSKDEIQHYSKTSKYILKDSANNIVGLYGIGRDVTEYNTAFEHLKLLTDNIPGGIASYLYTTKGYKILYFNDGFCHMLGYTREEYEEITKKGITNITFEEDVPGLMREIYKLINQDIPLNYTYRVHNKDNKGYKWVTIRGTISERHGDNTYVNVMLFDVTDAKIAEEEKYIHDKEMNTALNQLGKVIVEYNIEKKTLIVSEAYAKKHNIKTINENIPEAFIENSAYDVEMGKRLLEMYEEIRNGKERGTCDIQIAHHDGKMIWEHLEFVTIFDEEGKPIKALISTDDTTIEHMKYEIEKNRPNLGDGKILYHALFNVTKKETIEYFDGEENEVPKEEQLETLDGVVPSSRNFVSEFERKRFCELHNVESILEKYEKEEKEFSFDYRRVLSDGSVKWVRNIFRLMKSPTGNDILLFEYCYNVDDEKIRDLMNDALAKANYDFVARINAKNHSYIILTSDYNEKELLTPKKGEQFEDITGKYIDAHVHPDDKEFTINYSKIDKMKENLSKNEVFQYVCREIHNNEIFFKKITYYYLDPSLDIIIMTREDITQIMNDEMVKRNALATAIKAANQANSVKSQFLSRMSHELRTPMNAIIGLVSLSSTDIDNRELMKDNIEKIGQSAQYLLSLINDILEMSRIESGKVLLSETPFDFAVFISNLNAIIIKQALEKEIDYDVVVKNKVESSYIGDSVKLQEILVNILGNAVKFTHSGGKVNLSIETLGNIKEKATLRFVVSDTGIGIDNDYIKHIFEPFSQEITGMTSSSSGTGLGLAITKNLVDIMGGSIEVKSEKGFGTEFTVDVSFDVSADSKKYLNILSTMDLGKQNVLIVDDDEIACRSAQKILSDMNIKSSYVNSGFEAIELLKKKNDFTTIFMDWKMPKMDGVETTREARKIIGNDVKIIIMTAYDWRIIENEARFVGVDAFIEKPLFEAIILRAFEKVFMVNKVEAIEEKFNLDGCRVLLAEDNNINAQIAKRLLERVGVEVVVANNGAEALEIYTAMPSRFFDAILMDIRMPIMDGITASKNIRSLDKMGSKDIPIIAMTANAFDEDVELSLSSGLNSHLAKPIDPKLLFKTLEELIKKYDIM